MKQNDTQKNIDYLYDQCKNIKNVDQLRTVILKVFPNSINFKLVSQIGNLKIESLSFKNENIYYAIPLKNIKELLEVCQNSKEEPLGIRIISNSEVPLIPYQSKRYSQNIILSSKDFIEEYEKAYTIEYILSQIYTVYYEIDEFNEFRNILLESLECFVLEKYAAAISLMINLIEGISNEYCKNHNIDCGNTRGALHPFKALLKHQMNNYIENIMLFEYSNDVKYFIPTEFKYKANNDLNEILLYYNEGLNLFYSFLTYGTKFLYQRYSDYELNRNSINHGLNKQYYKRINFFKIFSCLECLSFCITLNSLGNFHGIKKELEYEYNEKLTRMIFWKKSVKLLNHIAK